MEWIEARIATTSQGIEVVGAMLFDCGVTGLQIEDDAEMKDFLQKNPFQWDYVDDELMNSEQEQGTASVVFYVSANAYGQETWLAVETGLQGLREMDIGIDLGCLSMSTENVNDEDWLNNWKKYFHPFQVGKRIVVKPIWEPYHSQKGELVFTIDPGHVFGTGLHQTTKLCIEQLEKHVTDQSRILDLGCGSGILSIIALMLGAESAFAVDLDPNAVDIAYKNARLNGIDIEKYQVTSGNVLTDEALQTEIRHIRADILVANIVADVVIGLVPLAQAGLHSGGLFIASGIIKERLADVYAALAEAFDVTDTFFMDDWVCVVSVLK